MILKPYSQSSRGQMYHSGATYLDLGEKVILPFVFLSSYTKKCGKAPKYYTLYIHVVHISGMKQVLYTPFASTCVIHYGVAIMQPKLARQYMCCILCCVARNKAIGYKGTVRS